MTVGQARQGSLHFDESTKFAFGGSVSLHQQSVPLTAMTGLFLAAQASAHNPDVCQPFAIANSKLMMEL
jgi:hypothetical protein